MSQPGDTDADSGYDAADNAQRCYALAVRTLRLQGVRDGRFDALPHDAEEVEAAALGAAERAAPEPACANTGAGRARPLGSPLAGKRGG